MLSMLLAMTIAQTPAYIDPGITGEDRAFLEQVLAPFPGYQGDAFVLMLDGRVLKNRLDAEILTATPVAGQPGKFRWPDGEEFEVAMPQDDVTTALSLLNPQTKVTGPASRARQPRTRLSCSR